MSILSLSEFVDYIEKRKNTARKIKEKEHKVQILEKANKKQPKTPQEIPFVVTREQVELAFYIRNYRRIHELSQVQMAAICSCYGEPNNIRITPSDISCYENYNRMPTKGKFQVLLNTMDIEKSDLK